eukprot:CAMPEP_0173419316 /NCGR_PEP_ID=MMETSP1357-20121228/1203_1 /TAXON_ID=77926 /ORGANISM="Hemiselmis rufescens, Strain PCC563" /LENGTH=444 /DNA_ID=CAMNT_0014381941 /DNA_START=73 /DNA_END=1403 /DNA_ORIENTATION=-
MSDTSACIVHTHEPLADQPAQAAASAPYETSPFDAADLTRHGIDASKCVWTEITPKNLRGLLLSHVSALPSNQSFVPTIHNTEASLAQQLLGEDEGPTSRVHLRVGLGVYSFDWEDHKMHLLHQRRGPIVGTSCGPAAWDNLVLLCEGEGGKEATNGLLNQLISEEEKTKGNDFTIFRWNVKYGYWGRVARKAARSLPSVVLPQTIKDKLVADLDQFLTPATYKFYVEHGIPYKRSFLFYGEPGAGKTSLIQALAGKYRRNLCIMQPTSDPKFNDDSLADAIKDAPPRSVIVLEDVDALFDKKRQANSKLSITFSGLLNALDGIANPDGQLFILTTNFRENLDSALIRNGRVDLHVGFAHATGEQMRVLFGQFYPDAPSGKAEAFEEAVGKALGGRKVNMAGLQHFFVTHRTSSWEEAVAGVGSISRDLDEKEEGRKEEGAKGG